MSTWVTRLLIANVAMFFVQATQPGLVNGLVFAPALVFIRPWTIITYMFLHAGMMHLLLNMMGLFFFGSRVEEQLGPKRFVTLYFLSGIAGALLSFLLSPRAAILGASGAVFGVMLAFAHFWPRDKIMIWGIIPVEARVLVLITTVMALMSGMGGSRGGVADFAHLGGYAGAWLYLRWLDANTGVKKFRRETIPKVADKSLANWKRVDTASVHVLNRDELNRILDKVSERGLGSLTPQEKAFLSNFVPRDDRVPPVS